MRKILTLLIGLFSFSILASSADDRNKDLLTHIEVSATKEELLQNLKAYLHSIADYEGSEYDRRVLAGIKAVTTPKDPKLNSGIYPALKRIHNWYQNKDALAEYWNLLTYLLARDEYKAEVTHPSVYLILGETYYKNGYYRSSLEALKQFSKNANPRDFRKGTYLNGLNIIGLCYRELGEIELAEVYLTRALDQAKSLDSEIWTGIIQGNMSWVYLQRGDTAKAHFYIKEDLRICRKGKVRGSMINSYIALGNLFLQQGQIKKAEAYSDSVDSFLDDPAYSNTRLKYSRLSHYKFNSHLYSNQEDYYSAFKFEQKHDSLKGYIQKSRIPEKSIEEFQLINDRTKNLEIDLLQTKLEKERLESNLLIWWLSASIVLISIMVFLFWQRSLMLKKVKEHNLVIRQVQSEVIKKNSEIQLQKKKLEAANVSKDKLFSIISHDLRSPMVALKEFMNMLKEGAFTKDEVYELLPHISKNINSLYQNSEQLLNWSRNRIRGIEVKAEVLPIVKVVQESVSMMKALADNKKITIQSTVTPNHLSVYADHTHLNVVLRNLLGNAIKFSYPENVVLINVFGSNEERLTHIQIIDHGIGISENQLNEMKNDLPLKSETGTNKEEGTGLGLAISQQFIAANYGKLNILSERGNGTTVEIVLPSHDISDNKETEDLLN